MYQYQSTFYLLKLSIAFLIAAAVDVILPNTRSSSLTEAPSSLILVASGLYSKICLDINLSLKNFLIISSPELSTPT